MLRRCNFHITHCASRRALHSNACRAGASSSSISVSASGVPLVPRRFASAASSSSSSPDTATLAELQALNETTSSATSVAATAGAAAEAAQNVASTTSTAASASAAITPPPVEMPALVKGVDTVLTSIYNTLAWLVPDVTPVVDVGVAALVSTQAALGIPWSAVLFGFGIAVRLSTLYFTLYGERASLRMQVAMPELKQAYHRFEITYYDPQATTKEVMAVSEKLKQQQAEVYNKYGTSNKKASAALLGSPFFLFGFWVAMRTTGTAPGVGATSWAWLPSLAAPDPLMILPCTVVGLTVINYEMLFRKKGGASGTGISSSIVLGVRVAAASCLWVISNFRAGVLIYWAGVSLTGLLQPLLMRSAWFHRAFKVPTEKEMVAALRETKVITEKATAATVGGKSPTQAFMDKLKEQRTVAQSKIATPSSAAATAAASAATSSSSSSTGNRISSSSIPITPEGKSASPLSYKVTSGTTGATIFPGSSSSSDSTETKAKKSKPASSSTGGGYFAPKRGGVAYRILHETDLEKKQKEEAEASEADPLMQRFKFAMPMTSQGVANPQKQQQLAEDIQKENEKKMEDAKRLQARSWKSSSGNNN